MWIQKINRRVEKFFNKTKSYFHVLNDLHK